MNIRARIADKLRTLADRLDYEGAPKLMSPYSFTFENQRGIVFREDGKGCPLWHYGRGDRERAHSEADTDHAIVNWAAGTARFGR
jgi:hypothetical protein